MPEGKVLCGAEAAASTGSDACSSAPAPPVAVSFRRRNATLSFHILSDVRCSLWILAGA